MTPCDPYPETSLLRDALCQSLSQGGKAVDVTIQRRSPNAYASTYPSEIVRCETGGRTFTVFAKYEVHGSELPDVLRWSVSYEADVYQHILSNCPLTTPRYLGRFQSPDGCSALWRDGLVYPVDRQSAAIGAAELDLAAILEGYEEGMAGMLAEEYRRARWPDEVPPGFKDRLAAAAMYWSLRWLGAEPECTMDPALAPRYEALTRQATAAGRM